jgi:hypothetical protein
MTEGLSNRFNGIECKNEISAKRVIPKKHPKLHENCRLGLSGTQFSTFNVLESRILKDQKNLTTLTCLGENKNCQRVFRHSYARNIF